MRMTASFRVPLLAALGCVILSACNPSGSSTATAQGDVAPASEQQPSVSVPSNEASRRVAPITLTEIDEAELAIDMSASGMCSFDKINGVSISDGETVHVQNPADFSVSGWLVDKREMVRPQGALRIQQVSGMRAWEISAGPGTGRGDVGRYLKTEGLKDAGFEVKADLGALPPGEYSLSLNHYSGDRRIVCDKGKRISVGS